PRIGVAVAEPQLHTLWRLIESRGQIAGVQQADPDAGVTRGGDQRFFHGMWFGIRCAVWAVVHIVELPDAAGAGQGQCAVGRAAAISASAMACGSEYGVPSGRWCT